jgi:uncharacterized glyoxalase superfamily protein PhnB
MERAPLIIQLSVADLGATEAFYAGILELPVQRTITCFGAPEHLVLSLDGCNVIFVEDRALVGADPLLGVRLENFPRGVGMTLHLTVTDTEGIYQELLDEQLEILYPLELKPYGCRQAWCFDPDGYLIVLEELVR